MHQIRDNHKHSTDTDDTTPTDMMSTASMSAPMGAWMGARPHGKECETELRSYWQHARGWIGVLRRWGA